MRWLQNISFSSLSISPWKDKTNNNDSNHKKQRYNFGFRIGVPKLIRPKELRNHEDATAKQLTVPPSYHTPPSSPTKPTSSPLAMPLPLPLPLPEGDADQRRIVSGGSGKTRSSPKPLHKEMIIGDGLEDDFQANVTVRSPPGSPLLIRPPRKSMSDIFQNYMYPTGDQAWSTPEMPTGLPPSAFHDYGAYSTDNTPFHTPPNRSPDRMHISRGGPTSPIPSPRLESNSPVNVHPLPLPPGAAMVSPSASVPQYTTTTDSLPMNSQWQKGKLIGRGTFGSVYVASNRETGALCAMKEVDIFPDDPKSAECIKQLEQEIKILSHLKHPNIVQYYGSEIAEDKFYIYLEYVHPGSINKYVRDHFGAITESVIRNFTRHILSGLAYLHATKTIHRDIKGANLLVDASGVVKLADFGMSKHLSGQRADLSLKGSPYWMAPELMQAVMQKDNRSELALAVDIWSLGCTIIEMYTGKAPWSEYEGAAAMFKVMKDTPPTPETLSPEGKDFLRCCFQRNPAERPSASMLLEHRFIKSSNSRVSNHLTDNSIHVAPHT